MKPSAIFFDARYIRVDHHDGISRFSAGLFEALNRKTDVVALISDPAQLEKLPPCRYEIIGAPTSALEPLVARQVNRLGAEVVFSPMQTMGTMGRKYKLILTLHDLIYYRHPTPPPSFNVGIRALWRVFHLVYWPQRMLLNRADAVATVSQTTKDLISKHRLTKRPVSVVYNAAETAEKPRIERNSAPSKKLVYMGSFMEYKNVETLIRGMALLPDFELVLLSRVAPERRVDLESLDAIGNVKFRNGVSEMEYIDEIDSSFALVSASKDEGFGIPLVESMNRGTPIIVSDIEIFREIGESAASYFNFESPEEFANQVRNLDNPASWKAASLAALERAKNFSWEASADALLKMVEKL